MNEKSFPMNLHPFKLLEWETADFFPELPGNPTHEHLVNYLCSFDVDSDMSGLRSRYDDVSKIDREITLTFEEAGIKENLVGPLRQAKTNYILGNYVGTIALCGIVAEKVALFMYKKHTTNKTKSKKFDRAKQIERIDCLKELGYIDEQSEQDFEYMIKARRYYLHHWNTPESQTAERAAQAYAAATRLVLAATKIIFKDGKVILESNTMSYLEKQGVFAVNERIK